MIALLLFAVLITHLIDLTIIVLLPLYFVPLGVALIITLQLAKRLKDGKEMQQNEVDPNSSKENLRFGTILCFIVVAVFAYLIHLFVPDEFLSNLFLTTDFLHENDELRIWVNRAIVVGYCFMITPVGVGILFVQAQKVSFIKEKFVDHDFISLAHGIMRSILVITPIFVTIALLQFAGRTWEILIP